MTAPETLKTLTLHGIWPWAICHLDKRVENRGERFARSIVKQVGDGWLAIHAGQNLGDRRGKPGDYEAINAMLEMVHAADWGYRSVALGHVLLAKSGDWSEPPVIFQSLKVPLSAIVAVCRIGRVLPPGEPAPWKVTESAAVDLLNVRVLPEPVPCKGSQGLWRLPEDVHAAVAAQGVLRG